MKNDIIWAIIIWGSVLLLYGYIIYRKEYTDHTNQIYQNVSATIIDNDGYLHDFDDKFHKTEPVKFLLIRLINDTTKYTELSSRNWFPLHNNKYIQNFNWLKFYYNHKIGDTLYFDYIRKDRFFDVTR
jgi:hypothetical protein